MNPHADVVRQLHRALLFAVVLTIACALSGLPLRAQDDASIAGIVRDPSGAPIPAATVSIKNLETGTQRRVETDQGGRFHAASLAVGTYEVATDKPGFRTERRSGIALVGEHLELDLTLQIGDVRQTVEVSADPDPLEATTVDTSGLIGERQVEGPSPERPQLRPVGDS